MEVPTWVAYATAWAATLVVILLSIRIRNWNRKLNLPPGPKPWPIIGNLNSIGKTPHLSLDKLSKKYGPLMYLKFGSYPCIVGSSVEMAENILKTNDIIFAGRPRFTAGKYTLYNYSDITWSQYGPYWRQARKMCIMELFSAKRLDSYEYIRIEELNSILKGLYDLRGRTIGLKDYLSDFSLNVISRMVLGKKYNVESEESVVTPKEFKKMNDELFLFNGALCIGDSVPWLGFLDLLKIKRMKALAKKFDRFLEHVLDEHVTRRQQVKEYVGKDMVDVLLQLADDPNLEIKLQRHSIKAFILDLIVGGTESSARMVEWALSELLRKPKIFEKATQELDRVIGRERWVQENDIINLPYIDAITKETMRLHPVAPFLSPRQSREDCKINGYDIPKGTGVLVNTWTISRDPNIWDNPNEFYPERFIGKDIDVKGQHFELLPFGAGRRICPGYNLGQKVILSSLANLIHGFNWKLPGNMKPEDLDMEEIYGFLSPRKIPLCVVAEPRLPFHMY